MVSRFDAIARPHRTGRRDVVGIESLEGRDLPSMMMPHALIASAADGFMGPALKGTATSQGSIQTGSATKKPRFYEFYTGPLRDDLNAVKATATLINRRQTLVLTGTVVGKIDTAPADESDESYYAFGINRGGATAPGPFPGRPDIRFDAVVVVSVEGEGVTGSVTDLKSRSSTELPDSAVSIQGNMVKIKVPTSLLPSTGATLGRYRVNHWPRSELPPADFHTVASFVPVSTTFRVASRR
jgi:hypothetical protein